LNAKNIQSGHQIYNLQSAMAQEAAMKTILVPLDGSALAERVLPYARLLARTIDARLHLLRVVTEAQHEQVPLDNPTIRAEAGLPPDADQYDSVPAWEALRQFAENGLAEHAAQLRAAGMHVTYEVRVGAPAATIVAVAAERHARMIAMATHGYSGLTRWALGSVADAVLHTTSVPVLLVRGNAPLPKHAPALKRIVVPLNGSELARQALPPAIELADFARAEVVVVQAIVPSIEEYLSAASPVAELRDNLRAQALHEYELHVGGDHPAAVTSAVLVGHAAQAIAEEVDWRRADLIVMATHGYSGLRRLVHGSVADQLLHATTTPLLLVRGHMGEG
jgi:nucleotide-binding universal stress UspA family protein